MNKFLQFLFFFISFIFLQKYLLAIEISGKAKVIDGDTIKINNEKIRLLGIDAFEIKQKCKSRNRTKYKCGLIAKSTLIEIISNQPVKCIKEKKRRWSHLKKTRRHKQGNYWLFPKFIYKTS